jgi:hypothetical protein
MAQDFAKGAVNGLRKTQADRYQYNAQGMKGYKAA